ncbi:DUF3187 family protein [Dokdonella immobilis]|uniref:DUF3187 family protein n=1 Tax=Dokdonella immobilis TaxID=578942 RepID=UPI001587D236|nr:DUF3187 family protein [Dokdonella immobilis]
MPDRCSSSPLQILLALILFPAIHGNVDAVEPAPAWLQTRDSNPFALATGLPPAPVMPLAGHWQVDMTLDLSNTELQQFGAGSSLLFDAESRETRFSVAYAFNERWSLRASFSQVWIGAGFLDQPIERFHRAFGFDNGDRGLLALQAPRVEVRRGGELLYALDRSRSGMGPLLIDSTRSWSLADGGRAGLTLGMKLPTGSRSRLSDSGSTDGSLGAFVLLPVGERLGVGVRAGLLVQGENRLLGDNARSVVPFASALLRYRLGENWSAVLQTDAHGPLYRDLPDFLGSASNQINFGLVRRLGKTGEFDITLAEDLPALHTSDVAINLGLRLDFAH